MVNAHLAETIELIKMKNYLIFLSLFLISCGGTRQTDSSKWMFSSNYEFSDNSYTLRQNAQLNDIGELNPIDNSKPFFVDGKEYFNVSIKFDKSKVEDFELTKKNIGTSTGASELETNKQTTRQDNAWLYIGLFVVLVLGVLAWFKFPSFRKVS